MSEESKKETHEESEGPAFRIFRINKDSDRDHAWGISGPVPVGTIWHKNNQSDCEGYCRFLNSVFLAGRLADKNIPETPEGSALPCPFCGNNEDPVRVNTRIFNGPNGSYEEVDHFLKCEGCGMTMGDDRIDQWGDKHCDYRTREEATLAWNTRNKNT